MIPWRNLLRARWAGALAAGLVAVCAVEVLLVRRPPHRPAQAAPQIDSLVVRQGADELVLSEPRVGDEHGPLAGENLVYLPLFQGRQGEQVKIHFTEAKLSPTTLRNLGRVGPAGDQQIDYGISRRETGDHTSCNTVVAVALAAAASPSSLRLSQPDESKDQPRTLKVTGEGRDLQLKVKVEPRYLGGPEPVDRPELDCLRWLRVGNSEINFDLGPPFEHEIEAKAGAVIRLEFPTVAAGDSLDIFPASALGSLRSREVIVRAVGDGAASDGSPPYVRVRAEAPTAQLRIKNLVLDEDALRLNLLDPGIAEGPGVGADASRWARLRRHPWWIASILALDVAGVLGVGLLCAWFVGRRLEVAPPQPAEGPYDVFLSYNRKDKTLVDRLAKKLAQRGLKVWLDEPQLLGGQSFQTRIEEAIQASRATAVLLGEHGLGRWQKKEMQMAFLKQGEQESVIPVLLPGGPPPEALPLSLQIAHVVDLRDGLSEQGLDNLVRGLAARHPVAQSVET